MKNVANRRFVADIRHRVNVFGSGSRNRLGNIAFRIVDISEESCTGAAGFNTCRFFIDLLQVAAKCALLNYFASGLNERAP